MSEQVHFRRTALALLTALLATSASRLAGADENVPPAIGLHYEVAPSLATCPSAQEFAAEVAGMIGVHPFREGASLRVSVAIREGARRGTAEGRVAFSGVSADDPDLPWGGEQTIRASDCMEVARTLALVMTVAVERLRSARAAHMRETAPPVGQPPAPPPESDAPDGANAPIRTDERERPARRPPMAAAGGRSRRPPALHVSSFAGVVVAADITPGATAGTSFGARVGLGALSVGVEGLMLAPSSSVSSSGVGGSVSSTGLEITTCWHLAIGRSERLDVHTCPVIAPLLLRGVGHSPALPRAGDAASLALGGRIGGSVEVLGPIRLAVELEALAPLTRHVFVIDDQNVWVQPALGFAAHGNVAVRFR